MKHFDSIIENLLKIYKDPNTEYASTSMFSSANDLSFAISRLKDAQKIFSKQSIDNKAFTTELWTTWLGLRDKTPEETARSLAFCIIQNTPLSNTEEQMKEVEDLFYKTVHTYTNNEALSKAFTAVFFHNVETKMPKMKDWEKCSLN